MASFYTQDSFAVVNSVLASAVAHSGTVTLNYPSGYTQADFLTGMDAAAYVIIGDNDRWNASDSKMSVTYNSSDITLTNSSNTTWAASSKVALYLNIEDGNDVVELSFPVVLSKVTAADIVTDYQPGIAGTIESFDFIVTDPVTTGSKLASINLEIGTTNLTGGVIALTSANSTPLGKVINGSAITGANVLTKASKLSIEASTVTAFVEGQGVFKVRIRKS